jgi:4-alpha-glucanotransferase
VVCDITIAPATAWLPPDAARRRWGLSAQLYAQRRRGDQGIGDFTTLGLIGEGAGRAGAAALGVNPLHMLFASNRERASPYHPSDRRFLDPHYIDVLGLNDLPTDAGWDAALATFAPQLAAGAASPSVAYTDVWRLKLTLLDARFEAFEKARLTGSAAVVIAEHDAFVTAGGESLWRFAFFEAIAEERKGQDWRAWPEALRAPTAPGVAVEGARLARRIAFFSFAQWLADRQLAAAAARAKAGGLEIGLYRDLAVGAAPDGAESWSRSEELADGVSVGAPPDPFSAEGQNWHLPPPDPMAGARMAWQGFSDLYGANMRHAGLLRIDHAMGLTRLFWIPQGGKPADGAYVRYPVADLIGHIALQSARAQCVVVGEDLGTVPEGFRPRLAAAEILCTRVVWFERRGIDFIPPSEYPPLAVSVVSTHDLPTLEGWWRGADIDERATLGFIDAPAREVLWQERVREKWALSEALQGGGFIQRPPEFEGSPPDWFVAAIHAFVAATPSLLAMAQVDDLAGETVATNLPGTDRERPNWRHRLRLEAADLFANPRAKAIIAALAARGKG